MSTWPMFGRVSLSLALVALLAAPTAAFEEKASTGTVGAYVVPDAPGVVCIYEDNPGNAVDELDKLSIATETWTTTIRCGGVIGDTPAPDVVRIEIQGLSPDGVSSLVRGSKLDPADVLAATGGNPFL